MVVDYILYHINSIILEVSNPCEFFCLSVVMRVYIDYPNKELGVVDTLELSGDPVLDMAAVAAAYEGHHGLHPELEAPIKLAR